MLASTPVTTNINGRFNMSGKKQFLLTVHVIRHVSKYYEVGLIDDTTY